MKIAKRLAALKARMDARARWFASATFQLSMHRMTYYRARPYRTLHPLARGWGL